MYYIGRWAKNPMYQLEAEANFQGIDEANVVTREDPKGAEMDATQIKEHMEVVGSDGEHVGIVDKVEGDQIKLTRHDSQAAGQHHFVPLLAVSKVDEFVTLTMSADNAKTNWDTE